MSVIDKFRILLQRIEPLESELTHASSHADSIKRRLEQELGLKRFIKIGSHSRNTAIKRYSDVDFLAVFSRDEVKWGTSWKQSSMILKKVRDSLLGRYSQTVVRRDQQAVVVEFGGGEYSVDIVPGVYLGPGVKNYPIYAIPDGNNWWLNTSPEIHNRYIREANEKSAHQLSRMTQLVKFWRFCRTPYISISSFHLELLLAFEGICVGAKSYAQCLLETFQLLAKRECRGLQDPLKISGVVSAVSTESYRESACKGVDTAYYHASKALVAETLPEAYRQWDIVFNGKFPK